MKEKHVEYWTDVARHVARLSNCPRAKHGCIIVRPDDLTMVSTGYNGACRGAGELCGYGPYAGRCERTCRGVNSGEHIQIGCIHAETNALYNAARQGVSTVGCWAVVTGEPCLNCAKALKQCGIVRVLYVAGGYSTEEGIEFLRTNGVEIQALTPEYNSPPNDGYF